MIMIMLILSSIICLGQNEYFNADGSPTAKFPTFMYGKAKTASRNLTIDFVVDKSSDFNKVKITKVINYLNSIYNQVDIGFTINRVATQANAMASDGSLHSTLRQNRKVPGADIMIIITGRHAGSIIGKAWKGKLGTNFAFGAVDFNSLHSLKSCAGLLGHEIGHILGLPHNEDKHSVMHGIADTYCARFTPTNLKYLKGLTLRVNK